MAIELYSNDTHRTMILSRVVIGHSYMASGPMKTHRRPSRISGRGEMHDQKIHMLGGLMQPCGNVSHQVGTVDFGKT